MKEPVYAEAKQGPKLTYSREGLRIDCADATLLTVQVPWGEIEQMRKRFRAKGAK